MDIAIKYKYKISKSYHIGTLAIRYLDTTPLNSSKPHLV